MMTINLLNILFELKSETIGFLSLPFLVFFFSDDIHSHTTCLVDFLLSSQPQICKNCIDFFLFIEMPTHRGDNTSIEKKKKKKKLYSMLKNMRV